MVEHLIKLQLTLTKNAFKRSVALVIGTIIGLLFAFGYGGAAAFGLAAIRFWGTPALAAWVVPLGMGTLSLLFIAMTVLVFGVDQTLDPARFAPFPIRARQLMPGLMIVGLFLGAGGLFLLFCTIAAFVAWTWSPLLALVALVSVLLGMLGTFLLSRVVVAAFAAGLSGRRSRDFAGIAFGLLALAFGLGMQFLPNAGDLSALEQAARTASDVFGWTPFGWAWAVPGDVHAGQWGLAAIRLLLAVALVVACWLGWGHYLDRALTSPIESSGGGSGKVGATSFADRLYPTTVWGAVAARSLKYWRRDPRRIMLVAMTVVMPVIWLAPMFLKSETFHPALLLIGPPVATFFFCQAAATELSYDGSALWTHIVSGVRGWEDRAGRLAALLTVLGPVVLLMLVVAIALNTERLDLGVACLGATVAMGCAGIGAGLFVGGIWNSPTAPAGNAFAKSSGGGLASLLSFAVGMAITLVAFAPTAALAVMSYWYRWPSAAAALVVGLLTAAGMLWFGVRFGGRQLEKRWPEILKQVTWEG